MRRPIKRTRLGFRQVAQAVSRDKRQPKAAEEPPQTRAECVNAQRPCPWYRCRYHLGIDVRVGGGLAYVEPADLGDMRDTCALDCADREGMTLVEVGDLLGVTRERIRQIEQETLEKIKEQAPELAELLWGE